MSTIGSTVDTATDSGGAGDGVKGDGEAKEKESVGGGIDDYHVDPDDKKDKTYVYHRGDS